MANIASYHRKASPRSTHDTYRAMPPGAREVNHHDVAALLRLSDGLDRSHIRSIQDLRCRIEPRHVNPVRHLSRTVGCGAGNLGGAKEDEVVRKGV